MPLFLAMIPGLIIYLTPFIASSVVNGETYTQNGLYLVYRENILRYFQPFDHQGPIYTYFIYLPVYLLPWALFFIPALWSVKSRWKKMDLNSKWIVLTLLALFMFFTVSGSRRSYYVLPLIPFAILLIADWITISFNQAKQSHLVTGTICFSFALLFLMFGIVQPWYYSQVGVDRFAKKLKIETKQASLSEYSVIMLDADTKLSFYLGLPPNIQNYSLKGNRDQQTSESLLTAWPILKNLPSRTIFITRKEYESLLIGFFPNYRIVEAPSYLGKTFLQSYFSTAPIALFLTNNFFFFFNTFRVFLTRKEFTIRKNLYYDMSSDLIIVLMRRNIEHE